MEISLSIYTEDATEASAILEALKNSGVKAEAKTEVRKPAKEEPKKAEEPKEEPKKEEPKKEEPKKEEPKEEKAVEISDKDIREAILKIGKELGKDAAKELLAKYDAPSAAKVPQDKRAAMVAEIEEMLNA